MPAFSMLEDKTQLSKLVDAVESGRETEIVITRNGKPAARLVVVGAPDASKRKGAAKGWFTVPEPDTAVDEEVAKLFYGDDPPFGPDFAGDPEGPRR